MNETVVEISQTGLYLHSYRGFMVIEKKSEELGKVPFSDIAVLLLTGRGNSMSTNLINRLIENNSAIVICGNNYHPSGIIQSTDPHNIHKARIHLQISTLKPLQKRLWQMIIKNKIFNQSQCLKYFGLEYKGMEEISKRVSSGDKENLEAFSAKKYWNILFGKEFRRDRSLEGVNSMLNYGYTIIRGAVARSVSASGLLPALGIKHCNKSNAFCLVDDLMEPFRPYVDILVKKISLNNQKIEITSEIKRYLAKILTIDLDTKNGISTISNCILRLAETYVNSLKNKKVELEFPLPITPLNFSNL
jgi:CRISPR-associated protein Cas1